MQSSTQKIDVFLPTYNSAAHLEECLRAVRRSLPVRRIVVIDHYSTDSTLKIAGRSGCEVLFEDIGLGYARELSFKLAQSDVFAMVESDLVYEEYDWYENARGLLNGTVAAVVASVGRSTDDPRGRYNEFWARHTPLKGREHGFSAGSTLFRREAVSGVRVPRQLMAYEDIYILRELRRRGWTYKWVEVRGIHYGDIDAKRKARWFGANARLLLSLDPRNYTLLRRHLTLPAKGAIASLATLDPRVFAWSLTYASAFFTGWGNPRRFARLTR